MRKFWRGTVAATALSLVALAAPAGAVTGSPPVPQDDHYTVMAGDFKVLDVLANDTDPDGDALAVCRVRNVPRALIAEPDRDRILVGALNPGTYTFTYYACDYSYLAPAKVTITVKAPPKMFLTVRKSTHPGMIRVANRGKSRFQFMFGSYKERKPDRSFVVKAHSSQLVAVRRTSLVWVAFNPKFLTFRSGIIRGIKLPRGTHELPPGAPPKSGSTSGSTSGGVVVGLPRMSDFRIGGRTGFRWIG
jgi:hypothetical protein